MLLAIFAPPHRLERPVGEGAELGRRRGERMADLLDDLADGDELAAAEIEGLALDSGDLARGERGPATTSSMKIQSTGRVPLVRRGGSPRSARRME